MRGCCLFISILGLVLASLHAYHVEAASVDLINDINMDILFDCWSGDDNFGLWKMRTKGDFHFEFTPNIFGTTRFICEIQWGARKANISVWEGSSYKTRLPCAEEGDCVWKVTTRGFWWTTLANQDIWSWNFLRDWTL